MASPSLRKDTTSGGNAIAKQTTEYDDLGRVFRATRFAVNPATGTAGNGLIDRTWYDPAGNVAKQQPAGSAAFTKTIYDGVGRPTKTFVGFDTSEDAVGSGF